MSIIGIMRIKDILNNNTGLPKKGYSGSLSKCTKSATIQMALGMGQLLEFRHLQEQLKQELTIMSKRLMTCWAVAVTALVVMSQGALAQGLTSDQQREVLGMVQNETNKLSQQIHALTKLVQTQQAPRPQAPRPQAPRPQAPRAKAPRAQAPRVQATSTSTTLQVIKKHLSGQASRPASKGKVDVNNYLQELVDEAKEYEDRGQFRKALKRLVDGDDSDKCCNGSTRACDYKDSHGNIDVNKLIECEIQRQRDIEERVRLRQAFKRLLSGDECCDVEKKEQACVETYPYYSSNVVYRSRSGSVLYPVCLE